MTDWWKTFFKPSVYPLADLVDAEDTEAEVRELLRRLPIPGRAKILDVACGVGRHSLLLAKRGYRVTGVDYSLPYLSEARRRAATGKIDVAFLRRDMRRLGFDGQFDAVLCLWTSLGYFRDYRDDLRALKAMFRALKPGGRLALDIVNGAWIQDNFKPKDWHEIQNGWELNHTRLRDGSDPASLSRWIFIKQNGKISQGDSFVRLYDRTRLKKALELAGFENILMMRGLLEKKSAGADLSRILAVARRPMDRMGR